MVIFAATCSDLVPRPHLPVEPSGTPNLASGLHSRQLPWSLAGNRDRHAASAATLSPPPAKERPGQSIDALIRSLSSPHSEV